MFHLQQMGARRCAQIQGLVIRFMSSYRVEDQVVELELTLGARSGNAGLLCVTYLILTL